MIRVSSRRFLGGMRLLDGNPPHLRVRTGSRTACIAACSDRTGYPTPATIERFETEYPNATFWATFGQSETSGLAMLSPYRDRPKSAGRPLFWRSITVVDGDDRTKPAGEIIDFVGGQIARYKRPKHVVLVDKLPRTAGATSIGLLLNQRTGRRSGKSNPPRRAASSDRGREAANTIAPFPL